jgi:hypothetical protein
MTTHTAQCHCGQLTMACEGEPDGPFMCHCKLCQRRTGTAFHLGVWYADDKALMSGEHKVYSRTGDQGMEVNFYFCPECGSNICLRMPALEGRVAVSTGCFSDSDIPAPELIYYCESKMKWVLNPENVTAFEKTPG